MLDTGKPRRTVRVFQNGRSRAIRIPHDFDFGGDEVIIQKEDDGRLTLEPVKKQKSLLEALAVLEPLPEEDWLPEIEDIPPKSVDIFSPSDR